MHAAVADKSEDHAVVLGKAASIGCKVKRRMFARVANRLTNLQLRTKETVDRLNFTVDLVSHNYLLSFFFLLFRLRRLPRYLPRYFHVAPANLLYYLL